jgi:hypothetical protein
MRFGKNASHLNAFFTEARLPIFKKILIQAVKNHWREDIYEDMVAEYEKDPPDPPYLTTEKLAKRRRNQYRKITKTFSDPNWCSGLIDAPDPDDMDEMEDEDYDAEIYPDLDDDGNEDDDE